jgi:CheY-like chemotaxis protein
MTYMDNAVGAVIPNPYTGSGNGQDGRLARIVVVEDGTRLSEAIRMICECLGVAVERLSSRDNLSARLHDCRPMAVIAEMDAAGQDGCHVMMTIAAHDRSLPVLLITGPDPTLLGAVDAVQEIWELSAVEKWPELLDGGAIVDFLFRAGRKGRCMRLLSV